MKPASSDSAQTPSTRSRPLSGFRILVAEDDPGLAWAVAEVLTETGAVVAGPYSTPGESLGAVRSGLLDAAYVDLELRLGISEPVLLAMRALALPGIVVSAMDPARRPPWTEGFQYLPKPVTARVIRDAFVGLLAPRRSLGVPVTCPLDDVEGKNRPPGP